MDVQATEWYQSRPASVQARIDTHPPNKLYRNTSYDGPTEQIVYLYAYTENDDGSCDTCTVIVSKKYNPLTYIERQMFGVSFTHLEMLTPEEEEGWQ